MTAAAKSLSELPPFPVQEFVKLLAPATKREVLCQLLRELRAEEPGSDLVPIESVDGERLGMFLPADTAAAEADAMYAQLVPETRIAAMEPYTSFDWDNVLTDGQLNALLKGESPTLQSR